MQSSPRALQTELTSLKLAHAQLQEQQALINQIVRAMRDRMVLADIFQTAINQMRAILQVSGGLIFIDTCQQIADVQASEVIDGGENYKATAVDIYQYYYSTLSQGQSVILHQIDGSLAPASDICSMLIVPLLWEGEDSSHSFCMGGISLYQLANRCSASESPKLERQETGQREWTAGEIDFVKAIADCCTLAIQQTQLREQLQSKGQECEYHQDCLEEIEIVWREQQEFLKKVIDTNPSLIFVKDWNGHFTLVNQAVADIYGTTIEGLIGKKDADFNPNSAEVAQFLAADREVIRTLQPKVIEEETVTSPTGEVRYFKTFKKPLLSAHSQSPQILGICVDITEYKLAEAAWRESDHRFQIMADTAPVFIWMSDTTAAMSFYNQTWLDFTGRTMTEELASCIEVIHPDDYQSCLDHYLSAFHARERLEMEYRIRRADGEYRWILDIGVPRFTLNGDFAGYIGSCIDITERKQAEAALQHLNEALEDQVLERTSQYWDTIEHLQSEIAQRQRVEALNTLLVTAIEQAHDAIVITDTEGKIQYINPVTEKITGYTFAESVGKRPTIFRQDQPNPAVYENVWNTIASGQVWRGNYLAICKDGSEYPLEAVISPVSDHNIEIAHYVIVNRDISERKQAEEQLRKTHTELEQQAAKLIATNQELQKTLTELQLLQGELQQQNLKLVTAHQLAEAQQRRYQDLFNFAPDGYVVTDIRGIIQEANRAVATLFWCDRIYLVGKPLSIFIPPTERPKFWSQLNQLRKNQLHSLSPWEINLQPRQGDVFPAEIAIAAICDFQDQIIGWRWLIRDVTKRQQVEAQLQQLMSLQRAILDGANYTIISTAEDGIIRTFNRAAERLLGYTAEEVIGQTTPVIIHDLEEVVAHARELSTELGITIEPGFEAFVAKARRGQIEECEWSYIRKDGSRFPVMLSITALHDAYGNITGFLGIAHDITQRKQAETALKQAKDQLQAVLDAVPGFVSWIDSDLRYLGVNQYLAKTFQVFPEAFIGQKLGFLKDSYGYAEFMRGFINSSANSASQIIDIKINSSIRNYLIAVQKYQEGTACVSVGIDISDRQRAEEDLKRQNLRSRLFTEISLKIRQSLQPEEIIQTTVTEVQQILQVDRVLIYRIWPNQTGCVVTEAVEPGWSKILGLSFPEEVFPSECREQYEGSRIRAITDIEQAIPEISDCLIDFLRSLSVKSKLVVPIMQNKELWGLLIAHQCSDYRHWTDFEIELLQQLGNQVGIALSQSQLLAALQQSEERYRSIVETAGEGIWVIDADSHTTFVNHKMAQMLGCTVNEMWGKTMFTFMDDEGIAIAQSNVERRRQGIQEEHDFKFCRQDSSSLWVMMSTTPLFDNLGEYTGALAMITDITERKLAEEKIKISLKEKEVLLKEIHHRVKNNLQVISSLLKLQSGYIKDEEALSLFTDSYNRVRSMALIHEKLYQSEDLARVNAADYINNLIANLFRSYNVSSQKIRLAVEVESIWLDVDTAIPCGLIINELVSNALKYAFKSQEDGELSIHFSLNQQNDINLLVRDNGVGLPQNFDIEETESLGLQLVYNLTEQLNGQIQIDSSQGTSFLIAFCNDK